MKNLLIFIANIALLCNMIGQNIGIGVTNPQYTLDLGGTLNLKSVSGSTAGILFDGPTLPTRTFMGLMDNDWFGIKSNVTNNWPFQMSALNGNIGIGNVTPAYRLDVKGRPRIRNTGASAAIWFDGAATPRTSLIGTINDDHVGFWGNSGAGWNIAMNVNNGNTGIGTSAPTSTLDVNGSFKMGGSNPKTGSFLMSADANGNAVWANTVAFKATGGYNDEPNEILNSGSNVWYKIYFNQIAEYNIGVSYQPIQSQFIAPEEGVYHFETVLEWGNYTDSNRVRLRLNRNGNIFTIGESSKGNMQQGPNYYFAVKQPSRLSLDIRLLAGDIVWVEAKAFNINAPGYSNTSTVTASNIKTWFTGNLVTRI